MNEYEILLLLDPDLPEEKQGEVVERVRTLIEQGGGTVDRHDAWGRRKLAYPIQKKEEGVYHLVSFTSEAETLDERRSRVHAKAQQAIEARQEPPG